MAKKETNISWTSFVIIALVALILGANFRFPFLEKRPMHTDEAILATKYVDFWKAGVFDYDNRDYHGPGLHNLTRAFGWVAGWTHPDQLTDAGLRTVVALCGMALLLLTLLIGDVLGRAGTALAMLLMAVSPMMVFYSRYFIMEMALTMFVALFLFSCWRYARSRNWLWLILAGGALGFQHATKETFVLNLGAAACGWIAARVICGGFTDQTRSRLSLSSSSKKKNGKEWVWVLAPAVLVSIALYSSGFKNWEAVRDSVTTYGEYLHRAGGAGHEKPWHYYLTLLLYRKDGVLWTEALIVGLAVVGMLNAFFGQHRSSAKQAFLVFLSIYTLALLTVYSLISYKTPWSILCAQHGLILLAGVGGSVIWTALPNRILRIIFAILIGSGIWHLSLQTGLAIHQYRADPRNPYVYSHTSTNVLDLVKRVEDLAALRPGAFTMQVINRDSGWPLPWYFRKLTSVGYQNVVPETLDSSVIIADSEQRTEIEAKLAGRPYESSSIYGLRPNVMLIMFIDQKLWDEFRETFRPKPQRHE